MVERERPRGLEDKGPQEGLRPANKRGGHTALAGREKPHPPTDLQLKQFLPWQEKLRQEIASIFGHFIAKENPQIDTYISFAWRWTC